MRQLKLSILCLLLASQVTVAQYQVRLLPEQASVDVEACFEPGAAKRLAIEQTAGIRGLRVVDESMQPRETIFLPRGEQQRCLNYQVDLTKLNRYGDGQNQWLMRSSQWLYRPDSLEGIELTVAYPRGWAVSMPWPRISRTPVMARYRFDGTPASWPNLNAFGRLNQYDIELPQGVWRVSVMRGIPAVEQDQIQAWLQRTANNLTAVYGRAPLPSTQLLVVPAGRGRGPVPWGQVNRGGGAAVHLVINQTKSYESLIADWTAAHEVSHLLLPYLGTEGRWLSEGIASYYQNIARARTGDLTEQQAFEKLHAGLERGRRGARDGASLRRANQRMRQDRNYMRVYWSGVAFWLQADLNLRNRERTLDQVLSEFAACHLPTAHRWTPSQLLNRLDELSESEVFRSLHAQMIDARSFPSLEQAYHQLGLEPDGRSIRLLTEGSVNRGELIGQRKMPAQMACTGISSSKNG